MARASPVGFQARFFAHACSNGVPLGRDRVESVGLGRVRASSQLWARTCEAQCHDKKPDVRATHDFVTYADAT